MQEPLKLPVMRRSMEAQLKYKKGKCPQFEVPFFCGLLESDELFSVLSPDYPARTSIFLLSLDFSALSGNYTVTHRMHHAIHVDLRRS